MRQFQNLCGGIALVLLCMATGCVQPPAPPDYTQYLNRMPKSILVLPPQNQSTQVHAPEAFLSTITAPLAERGYYVFPVAVVDRYMKENGLPTSGEMHQVSPQRLGEVFGADAVLYITIKSWTTTYLVIDSSTLVGLSYRLVDSRSGIELWKEERSFTYSTSSGQSDALAALMAAAIHAAINPDSANERALAASANYQIIHDAGRGMLVAARHPRYPEEMQRQKDKHQKLSQVASAKGR